MLWRFFISIQCNAQLHTACMLVAVQYDPLAAHVLSVPYVARDTHTNEGDRADLTFSLDDQFRRMFGLV